MSERSVAEYEINFDHILDIALRGVRRASLFMGLGINAATDPQFKSFGLTKFSNLQIGPTELSEEDFAEVKDNFRLWIEAAGFRELVDTFGVFLDAIHWSCSLAKEFSSSRQPSMSIFQYVSERQSRFVGEGIPNKLNILKQCFGLDIKHADQLKSLNKARNCLTHRRGLVAAQDCDGDRLRVSWLGMDLLAIENNGTEHLILVDTLPIHMEHGGKISIRMEMRERYFFVDQMVALATHDLAEICWFFDMESRAICSAAIKYSKDAGIPDRESNKIQPETNPEITNGSGPLIPKD